MKSVQPFPERASFLWAFILGRGKLARRARRNLPSNYVPTVSVVVPTLNEAENLPYVLPYIPDVVTEVLLVDGHSTDNTVEVARQLRPDIVIVQQQGRGKGAALRTGFAGATGDIIVMIDADGSTDPREIPAFVDALLKGADYAKGSRFTKGGGTSDMEFHRKMGNLGFVWMVRILFGGSFTDLCYGYNAFWADVLPDLHLDGDGFEIETIMNVRALEAKLNIVEVGSFEFERRFGVSRLRTFPDGWRVLKAIGREWKTSVKGALRRKPAAVPQPRSMPALTEGTEVEVA